MIRTSLRGLRNLRNRLQALALPPAKRRQVLRAMARRVVTHSKNRIRSQTDLEGTAFSPRKDGKRKRMLAGLARRMKVIAESDKAVIRFASGIVAARHQRGYKEHFTAEKLARRQGENTQSNAPATRRQAKRLVELGYKRRHRGRWITPTISWIVRNMSVGQAGAIIRGMRANTTGSWEVVLPARAFLGASETDKTDLMNVLAAQVARYRS